MKRQFVISLFALVFATAGPAREATAQAGTAELDGSWQGILDNGQARFRLVLNISRAADGAYLGSVTNVDAGGARAAFTDIQLTGESVRLESAAIPFRFEGSLTTDGSQLKGTWTQFRRQRSIEFTRTSAATARPSPPTSPPNPFGMFLEMTVPAAPVPF